LLPEANKFIYEHQGENAGGLCVARPRQGYDRVASWSRALSPEHTRSIYIREVVV